MNKDYPPTVNAMIKVIVDHARRGAKYITLENLVKSVEPIDPKMAADLKDDPFYSPDKKLPIGDKAYEWANLN